MFLTWQSPGQRLPAPGKIILVQIGFIECSGATSSSSYWCCAWYLLCSLFTIRKCILDAVSGICQRRNERRATEGKEALQCSFKWRNTCWTANHHELPFEPQMCLLNCFAPAAYTVQLIRIEVISFYSRGKDQNHVWVILNWPMDDISWTSQNFEFV